MVNSFSISSQSGFSSLEMLVALPILIVGLTAAVMVSFGAQSLALDTETNSVGLELAQNDLELARKTAMLDFYALNSNTFSNTSGGLNYTTNREVTDYPCMKAVSSKVTWSLQSRAQYSQLTTLLTNPVEAAQSGSDCESGFPSPWIHPGTYATADLTPGGNNGSDVDVLRIGGVRYAFVSSTFSSSSEDDLWIFNLATLNNIILASSVNIDTVSRDRGANSLDVAQSGNGNWYAYLAHHTDPPGNLAGFTVRQLMVVNVTNPASPQLIPTATRSLPGVGNSAPQGWSIKYFENKLYIGTRETFGNEFHVYDVSNPENPVHLRSLQINHNVEDIQVRKQNVVGVEKTLAYLALTSSSTSEEVWVLDVTNPVSAITKIGGYNSAGDVDANALSFSGNKLVVGKDRSATYPELLVLDISNPTAITLLASKDITMTPSTAGITDLTIVANYAFLGTSDSNEEFQVWDLGDLTNIWKRSSYNFPQNATGVDYIDNVVVTSVRSNEALHIIYDTDYPPQ